MHKAYLVSAFNATATGGAEPLVVCPTSEQARDKIAWFKEQIRGLPAAVGCTPMGLYLIDSAQRFPHPLDPFSNALGDAGYVYLEPTAEIAFSSLPVHVEAY